MPFEVGGTEGEQGNPMVHVNPDPQLLGVINPLLRFCLDFFSKCTLLHLLNEVISVYCFLSLLSPSIASPRKSFMEGTRTKLLTSTMQTPDCW